MPGKTENVIFDCQAGTVGNKTAPLSSRISFVLYLLCLSLNSYRCFAHRDLWDIRSSCSIGAFVCHITYHANTHWARGDY